jgi:predicted nucleic acid-binding protein
MIVLDASVAVKCLAPESGSVAALALMSSGVELISPDYLHIEVANVLWSKTRRGIISAGEADAAFAFLLGLPVGLTPSPLLLGSARKLASSADIAIFDALYVALALERRAEFATSDDALGARLRKARLKGLKMLLI